MVTELRMYSIKPGKMEEFVEGWTKGVYPLRLKHGYRIPGAWVVEATNQFAWLLAYDGPEEWETKNRAYYDSPERKGLDPDPAEHIAQAEHWFVRGVVPME